MKMNTEFCIANRELHLRRYPCNNHHVSLQAWDAADELLLNHIVSEHSQDLNENRVLCLFNDEFGALATAITALGKNQNTFSISDSWISQKATQANLKYNALNPNVTFLSDLQPIPKAHLILLKVPRSLALLEYQLDQIRTQTQINTTVIASAKVNALTPAVFKLFERYIGAVTTSLAKKKSRLLFCSNEKTETASAPFPSRFETQPNETGTPLVIVNHANVFSRQKLDIGARVMLQYLPDLTQKPAGNVIDLGCGNGVLGLALLAKHPNLMLHFVDESYMALASAEASTIENFGEKKVNCRYIASNCLEEYKLECYGEVDLVVCNPPFHQQNTITEHIANQMFVDAYRVLKRGGELRIVANRHLPYGQRLKKLFGGFSVLASDRKFVILSSIKRK